MYLVLEVININCKTTVSFHYICISFHYNFRKFSFAARVVSVWNSLPDHVVDVNSLKQLKTRLDKFWSNQDVTFDWTAEITGTGDRSEFKLETVLESSI